MVQSLGINLGTSRSSPFMSDANCVLSSQRPGTEKRWGSFPSVFVGDGAPAKASLPGLVPLPLPLLTPPIIPLPFLISFLPAPLPPCLCPSLPPPPLHGNRALLSVRSVRSDLVGKVLTASEVSTAPALSTASVPTAPTLRPPTSSMASPSRTGSGHCSSTSVGRSDCRFPPPTFSG